MMLFVLRLKTVHCYDLEMVPMYTGLLPEAIQLPGRTAKKVTQAKLYMTHLRKLF